MKKYLMYLVVAILVAVVAFFAYKKIYGIGSYGETKQNALFGNTVTEQAAGTATPQAGMFE